MGNAVWSTAVSPKLTMWATRLLHVLRCRGNVAAGGATRSFEACGSQQTRHGTCSTTSRYGAGVGTTALLNLAVGHQAAPAEPAPACGRAPEAPVLGLDGAMSPLDGAGRH